MDRQASAPVARRGGAAAIPVPPCRPRGADGDSGQALIFNFILLPPPQPPISTARPQPWHRMCVREAAGWRGAGQHRLLPCVPCQKQSHRPTPTQAHTPHHTHQQSDTYHVPTTYITQLSHLNTITNSPTVMQHNSVDPDIYKITHHHYHTQSLLHRPTPQHNHTQHSHRYSHRNRYTILHRHTPTQSHTETKTQSQIPD
jgi:hypothetical protein